MTAQDLRIGRFLDGIMDEQEFLKILRDLEAQPALRQAIDREAARRAQQMHDELCCGYCHSGRGLDDAGRCLACGGL